MEREYAGFWVRVIATIVDALVLLVPTILIEVFSYRFFGPANIGYWDYQYDSDLIFTGYDAVSSALSLLVGILYYGVLTSKRGGTLGKSLLGLRVITNEGGNISVGRSIGRYFAYIPSGILFIGYIMVGFSSRKQGMHDKICKTYVVYK